MQGQVFLGDAPAWRRTLGWVGAGLAVVVAGCGERFSVPTTYEVKGKVLLPDGKPLGVGRVFFGPQGDPPIIAKGDIAPDGTFSLTTDASAGAVPGVYRVWVDPTPREPSFLPKSKLPRVRPKYTQQDSTDIVVTVKAEPNQLQPFRLK